MQNKTLGTVFVFVVSYMYVMGDPSCPVIEKIPQ